MSEPAFLVVGQVIVDVFGAGSANPRSRLGGIFHAARALKATGQAFALGYIAPTYLDPLIVQQANALGATSVVRLGEVTHCPNILIVGEPTEAGNQGYYSPLWREHQSLLDPAAVERLDVNQLTAALVFPGGYDLSPVLQRFAPAGLEVFVDIGYGPEDLEQLRQLGRPYGAIITSTSANSFAGRFAGDPLGMTHDLLANAEAVVLKENRGGTRLFYASRATPAIAVGAQVRAVKHSVGVGDCFDAVFAARRRAAGDRAALGYASTLAAEYASTFDDGEFLRNAEAILSITPNEISELVGVRLPWERRKDVHVYVAGPDFANVDVRPIDAVAEALRYHNFSPHLPVREHGEIALSSSTADKLAACEADMNLLDRCQLFIAVLLYNDPGTLVELGIAIQRGLPTIVYDPYRKSDNLILTGLPSAVATTLDDVISAVFRFGERVLRERST